MVIGVKLTCHPYNTPICLGTLPDQFLQTMPRTEQPWMALRDGMSYGLSSHRLNVACKPQKKHADPDDASQTKCNS